MIKQYSAQIRFNWGFHDATNDKANGRNRATIKKGNLFCLPNDDCYCSGYYAGLSQDISNGRPDSSLDAWIQTGGVKC